MPSRFGPSQQNPLQSKSNNTDLVEANNTIRRNERIMLASFENLCYRSPDKGSPIRYSSSKGQPRVPARTASVTPTKMVDTPSTCSPDSFAQVSLSSSSSSSSSTASQRSKSILLRSSISISEDGAEVVLCSSTERDGCCANLITPRKLSLLDADMTPSPLQGSTRSLDDTSHVTPKRVSFCGLGDCPNYSPMATFAKTTNLWSDEDDDTMQIQQKISAILSVPSCDNSWLNYWQVWGLICNDSNTSSKEQDAKEAKRHIQRVLKNRAFDLNAKHQRLYSLRKDLCPFSFSTATVNNHSSNASVPMGRFRSYSGHDRTRSKSTPRAVTPEKPVPFLQRAFQCGSTNDSPVFIKTNKEEMFYDSDPEDFVGRRHGRHPAQDKENIFRMKPTISRRQDDPVAALVQEMMNEQMTLILHDDTASAKQLRPHGVICWIERGQQLRNSIIAPKLFWKSIQTPKMMSEQQATNHVFNSINLMDISRILPATNETVDRTQFPFCKPKHAFFVRTLDQSLLLQTNSATERDRIVKSMRLVVARLGSLLLTNNGRLADEYFAFADQGRLGPGEEPYWLSTV
jgi:hypothetical protein